MIKKTQQILFILLGISIPTSIAITNILIALLVCFWLLEKNFNHKIKVIVSSRWIIYTFAIIILYAIGLLWGDNHLNAGWQFQRLSLLLVFPILTTTELRKVTINQAVILFLVTAFVSAVIALLINQKVLLPLGAYFSFIDSSWKNSAFMYYNYHNIILSFASFLSLYILFEKKTNYPYIIFLFLITYSLSIFSEPGRAGHLLFNLAVLFNIFFYYRKRISKLIALIIVLFSCQIIAYNTSQPFRYRVDTMMKNLKNKGVIEKGNLEDIRFVFFKESISRIAKKPFFGHGTGSFGTILKREVSSGHEFYVHTTPHNQYLYIWFEIGIIGLAVLLLIFFHQIKELMRKKDGLHRALLPLFFLILMTIDSYLFIFTICVNYIFLYTICSNYKVS